MESKPTDKIGLALGSGSARGWAHIGVIQALADAGVRIDYVAGSSIGAVAGAIFASGGVDRLFELVPQLDWKKFASFFDIVFPKSGLVDGRKVARFVRKYVTETDIEDLPIPFCAVATDLATGKPVLIREGDIIDAVRASISFPGVFTPVRRGGQVLVDGGLSEPIPVSVVRQMGADFVIAVDLNHDIVGKKRFGRAARRESQRKPTLRRVTARLRERSRFFQRLDQRLADMTKRFPKRSRSREKLPNIFDVLIASLNIMESQISAARLESDPPDLLVQPELGHVRFLEFHRAREAIEAGYVAAKEQLMKLEEGDFQQGSASGPPRLKRRG